MFNTKAIFGILSAIFILLNGIPYFVSIYKKKVRPHVLSWLGWSFITALGGFAMLASGSHWSVAIVFANTVACLLIVIFSLIKKIGVWRSSKLDFLFFIMGILGIILWQTLNMPVLAIICAVLADLSFGIPTIIKVFKNPKSEPIYSWIASTLSGFFSMFTIENFTFSESVYPIYLFIYDALILFLSLQLIMRIKSSSILTKIKKGL